MRYHILLSAIIAIAGTSAHAAEPAKELSPKAQKLLKHVKKLDKRIDTLDKDIIKLQRDLKTERTYLEKLEIDEAKARETLKTQLSQLNLLARDMARVERLPTEAMSLIGGSLREGHKRAGIIAQGRKSLAKRIQSQREDVYELQDIRTKKQEKADNITEKQAKLALHRQKLQKLFDQQIKSLRLSSKEHAKLVAQSRKASKKARNLEELTQMARQVSLTPAPVKHRSYDALPVRGTVIRNYGESNQVGVRAQGITVETTTSEPVLSLKDGRIIYSDTFRDYGHIVIVEYENGINMLFSGLDASSLKVGDYARAGQAIGKMPSASSPELYLEVRKAGQTINPLTWIQKNKG